MNKIEDLIVDALKEDDKYKLMINFIVCGLISYENNDTSEKISANNEHLYNILEFIDNYHDSDNDKNLYLSRIAEKIKYYLNYSPES